MAETTDSPAGNSDEHPTRRAGRMTRRAALSTLAAGGLGFALWPRRPRSRVDVPAGRTVLTYWEKWTGAEGEAVQRVVDMFNESQSRLWVQRVPVSDIMTKAMVAIGGGDAPDLVGLFNFNIPLFAEAGAILPLDDFPASTLGEEHYAPAIWKLLTYEGRWWAGVTTCHTMALYYNRGVFREAGLDPQRPPRTIAELDDAAAKLTMLSGDGRIERAGFLQNLPNWWPYFWPIMFGGEVYDARRDTATLLSPANVNAYEWVASYPARYGREATTAFAAGFGRAFSSTRDPFLSGRVAMIVQGPWIANFARRYAPDLDYACAPVPTAEAMVDPARPTGMLEADVVMIPRGAAHPEAAWEFLQFTQRRDVQERLARAQCKGSPLRRVSPEFLADHPNPFVAVHDAVCQSPAVQTAPPTRVWPQYSRMIGYAFDAIWAGADVTAELRSTQDRAQELLDQARTRRAQRRGAGATVR
jgi:ABC-type glycerol-3-phosphate transport system substrate-binding protein